MTDIAKLVDELTLDEKATLTAGADLWSTTAVPRLGIPQVRLTDGPNGARGTQSGPAGPTAACLPCGSALGATWDPGLVEGSARVPGWQVDPGRYELHIGRSSAAIDHVLAVEIIA